MKQITTVLLILLHLATLKSQELSPNDQQLIRTLIQHVKANNKYRYASWKRTQTQSEKPVLILQNGEINFDGSGGNHSYIFKSGEYSYICEIIVLGPQPDTSYELIVTKNGTELMRQKAKLYR